MRERLKINNNSCSVKSYRIKSGDSFNHNFIHNDNFLLSQQPFFFTKKSESFLNQKRGKWHTNWQLYCWPFFLAIPFFIKWNLKAFCFINIFYFHLLDVEIRYSKCHFPFCLMFSHLMTKGEIFSICIYAVDIENILFQLK